MSAPAQVPKYFIFSPERVNADQSNGLKKWKPSLQEPNLLTAGNIGASVKSALSNGYVVVVAISTHGQRITKQEEQLLYIRL